jgi:hypothetical protein
VARNARRSILTSRQHLLNEAESLLADLPLDVREQLPDSKAVRPRLGALAQRNRRRRHDAPATLRLRVLDAHHARIALLDREENNAVKQLEALVRVSASTLASSVACRRGRSPSCSSRSQTRAASPRAASHPSTARRRWPRRRLKAPASRSVIATTPATTGASTPSCTAWPSGSCAANPAPRRSTSAPARADTPSGSAQDPQAPPLRRHLASHDT